VKLTRSYYVIGTKDKKSDQTKLSMLFNSNGWLLGGTRFSGNRSSTISLAVIESRSDGLAGFDDFFVLCRQSSVVHWESFAAIDESVARIFLREDIPTNKTDKINLIH
jgi:hypothetical protein